MINLLQETLEILSKNNKNPQDVEWCGSRTGGYFTWDHFAKIANIDYNDSWGIEEVCYDLVVVGKDWWLERHQYDGSEWWEYKQLPIRPEKEIVINSVLGRSIFENKS